jgi:hypothetical protein
MVAEGNCINTIEVPIPSGIGRGSLLLRLTAGLTGILKKQKASGPAELTM